ncbi:hypothetical protein Droror1_Dr00001534 [Drosera rotundifolia]
MITQSNLSQETHYDVLHVKEDASYEVIRASYRSALVSFHPDKLHNASKAPGSGDEQKDKFYKVQKAWDVLSNSKTRALYDVELQSLRYDTIGADDICLEDMVAEVSSEVCDFYHQCNCGDYFSVSFLELEEMGYELLIVANEILVRAPDGFPGSIVLSCGSCSLKIQFLISADVRVPLRSPNL